MKPISFGSAAPKDRAIDVGANLLGEWIEEQARKRRATLRDGSILGASALFAVIVVPILLRSTGEASRNAAALKAGVTRLDRELEASDLAKKEAQPGLLVGEMCLRTRASFDRLLEQTDAILRAGNSHTALSSVRCDVQGGEAKFIVQAAGEDDAAADAFALSAGAQGAKVDSITSSRPSELLGPRGVSFTYEKRIGVSE